jgi:hypothetical protein
MNALPQYPIAFRHAAGTLARATLLQFTVKNSLETLVLQTDPTNPAIADARHSK